MRNTGSMKLNQIHPMYSPPCLNFYPLYNALFRRIERVGHAQWIFFILIEYFGKSFSSRLNTFVGNCKFIKISQKISDVFSNYNYEEIYFYWRRKKIKENIVSKIIAGKNK